MAALGRLYCFWSRQARRWTDRGEKVFPMLESAVARESPSGFVRVGEATLACGKKEPGWLFASPTTRRYAAACTGDTPSRLVLTLPGGKVEIPSLSTGMVV